MKPRNHKPRNRREQIARERALAALAVMRRDRLSLTAAAKAARTDLETVQRYVGSALFREGFRGHHRARAYDRIPRTLNVYTPGRSVTVTVNSSRTATRIAEHRNAVKKYLNNQADESVLDPFRGKTFRAGKQTYEFVTDPKILAQFGESGFRAEGMYRAIQGVAA
jgi:hypothetical protein